MTAYTPPRVTFVGSDPKIPALRAATQRMARVSPLFNYVKGMHNPHLARFAALWQARNRRTRVLMNRNRNFLEQKHLAERTLP